MSHECNFYVKKGESLNGAQGYIENCQDGCDLSLTDPIGTCSGSGDNCESLCRNNSPYPRNIPQCTFGTDRQLCRKKESAYEAVKQNRQLDCCSITDAATLRNLDCPPTFREGSNRCALYLNEFCKIGDNIANVRCERLKTLNPI